MTDNNSDSIAQSLGAWSGSRERGQEVVPALTGFDPARDTEFGYIMARLTADQRAFILRMKATNLDQEIGEDDWDAIEPKVDNDDFDGYPYWFWFGGMRASGQGGGWETTFRFNDTGLAIRAAIAMEAATAGETCNRLDPKDDSAGPQGHRPNPVETKSEGSK